MLPKYDCLSVCDYCFKYIIFLTVLVFILFTVSKRFKIYKKYTYRYEAEIQNRVTGTSPLMNGPKLSCKVHQSLRNHI